MTKYLVIYHAPAAAFEKMKDATPEQMKAGMEPWMQWAERCGDGLVDLGSPLGRRPQDHRGGQFAERQGGRRGIRFCRQRTRTRRTRCCWAIRTWNGRKAARSKCTRRRRCRRNRLEVGGRSSLRAASPINRRPRPRAAPPSPGNALPDPRRRGRQPACHSTR